MSELKPCPFCGGTDIGMTYCQPYSLDIPYDIFGCKNCGANFYAKATSIEQSGRTWNTRAPDPRIAELEAEVDRCKAIIAVFSETKANNPPDTGKEKETI